MMNFAVNFRVLNCNSSFIFVVVSVFVHSLYMCISISSFLQVCPRLSPGMLVQPRLFTCSCMHISVAAISFVVVSEFVHSFYISTSISSVFQVYVEEAVYLWYWSHNVHLKVCCNKTEFVTLKQKN